MYTIKNLSKEITWLLPFTLKKTRNEFYFLLSLHLTLKKKDIIYRHQLADGTHFYYLPAPNLILNIITT